MPQKSEIPLVIKTLRLYEGDQEILEAFYPELGYNAVVRELVHKHCRKLREREARSETPRNVPAIEFTDNELRDIVTGTDASTIAADRAET